MAPREETSVRVQVTENRQFTHQALAMQRLLTAREQRARAPDPAPRSVSAPHGAAVMGSAAPHPAARCRERALTAPTGPEKQKAGGRPHARAWSRAQEHTLSLREGKRVPPRATS